MALQTLLHFSNEPRAAAAFAFEHWMQHKTLLAAVHGATPEMTVGVNPYWLDPTFNNGKFHLNHGQAHLDALQNVPSYFGALKEVGLANQNLVDTDLDDEERRTWWTFQNHTEHRLGRSVLPSPW